MLLQLLGDESGVVISAELVLVLSIAVLAMVVGLSEVAAAVNFELNDLSNSIGVLDQSMGYTGFIGNDTKSKSFAHGATFIDDVDDCDTNYVCCDIVVGVSATTTTE